MYRMLPTGDSTSNWTHTDKLASLSHTRKVYQDAASIKNSKPMNQGKRSGIQIQKRGRANNRILTYFS